MPRTETLLRVFVASPRDVAEEREQLQTVVTELNLTLPPMTGIRIELVRWETHATPGTGADAQDVINTQIGDDYDVFVGILWKRFGSATGRAESGTAEEFQRAYERFSRSGVPAIMVYFKDAALPPSEIDIDQLGLLRRFRSQLEEKGTLYWPFKDRDEFAKLLRLHLTRQVQKWAQKLPVTAHALPKGVDPLAQTAPDSGPEHDEEGLFDLILACEEHVSRGSQALQRMTEASNGLGRMLAQRNTDINAAKASVGAVPAKEAARLINAAAQDMDDFVTRMRAEMPIVDESFSKGFDAMVGIVELSVDFEKPKQPAVEETRKAMRDLRRILLESGETTAAFRQTIASIPRATTRLNRAKRLTMSILDEFNQITAKFAGLVAEIDRSVGTLYQSD